MLVVAMAALVSLAVETLWLIRANRRIQQTNQQLAQAERQALESFNLTRGTLTKIVGSMSEQLFEVPQAEQVALDAVRDAVQLYSRLRELKPEDELLATEFLKALKDRWYAEWLYGRGREEAEARSQFESESGRLQRQFPQNGNIAALRAELLLDLALEAQQQGDAEEAERLLAAGSQAASQAKRLAADSPDVLTSIWKDRYVHYAIAVARKAPVSELIALARQMVEAQAQRLHFVPAGRHDAERCVSIDNACRLAAHLVETGASTEASAVLAEAQSTWEQIDPENAAEISVRLAHLQLIKTHLLVARSRDDAADMQRWLDQREEVARLLALDFPQSGLQQVAWAEALLDLLESSQQLKSLQHEVESKTDRRTWFEQAERILGAWSSDPTTASRVHELERRLEIVRTAMSLPEPN